MSRISNDAAVLSELAGLLMDNGFAAIQAVAAPAAQTSATLALTYTTDDPAITADGALTVADGDAVTAAENIEGMEEIVDQINKLVADVTAIRTALATAIASGASKSTAPAALTARSATLAITYTTDDPAITANASVTVADGDLYAAAEFHEYVVEAAAELDLVYADVAAAHLAVTKLINDGVASAPVLAARTSTNGGVAVVYTTDDPGITPNAAVTIADGDTISNAEGPELMEEMTDQIDKLGDDYTALKTAYDLYLTAAGVATS